MRLKVLIDHDPQSPREWDNLGTIWISGKYSNLSDKDSHEPSSEENIRFPIVATSIGCDSISLVSKGARNDGWVYVSKEKALKEYGRKNLTDKLISKICRVIEAEINVYNLYLEGEVYGFVIEDDNGNIVDSCFGFYGSDPKTNGMSDHIDWKLLT